MQELTPRLFGVFRFTYGKRPSTLAALAREKTQYCYRLLVFLEGEAVAELAGDGHPCRPGDVLYLPPGECYRLHAPAPLTLLQVSFSLFGGEEVAERCGVVPASELRRELCEPLPEGEAFSLLAHGGVFSDTAAVRALLPLLSVSPRSPLFRLLADAALYRVLADILRPGIPGTGKGEEILAYIDSHPDRLPTAEELATRFSYHKNYINALVKRASGLSLGAYLRRTRMAYARDLLTQGALSPAEVAATLGYYDYSHFYKAFKAEKGCSPTAYLAASRGKDR